MIIIGLLATSTFAEPLTAEGCVDGKIVQSIALEGLKHTREAVVLRELQNASGHPFSLELWKKEQRTLQDLDLFADVKLECSADSASLVLHYQLLELFQYLPSPTVKQSDQDGWMVGGALAALNLFGYGIRAEVQARTTVDPWMQAKEYAFYASAPWAGSKPISWSAQLIRDDSWDPLRNFKDDSWNSEFDAKALSSLRWGGLITGGFRSMQHTSDSLAWLSTHGSDWVPALGAGVVFDNRDALWDTRKGIYSEWRVTQNGGVLGGAADYTEYLWDAEGSLPLGPGLVRATSLVRLRPGTVGFYDRLQQGGANTLRGFSPDSSVHGNSEIIENLEWREPILERKSLRVLGIQGYYGLQWVLGVDGAWLWDKGNPGWDDYRSSVYAGIHIVVPAIDRIRIEVGANPRTGTWAITVGLFEKAVTQRWRSR